MAQKISMAAYNAQSKDYTKKALEELNEQMKKTSFAHENDEYNPSEEDTEEVEKLDTFIRKLQSRSRQKTISCDPKLIRKNAELEGLLVYTFIWN